MANNIDVKDAAGGTKVIKTTDSASVHTPHHLCEQSGSWSVSITGAIDTELPAAAALGDNESNATAMPSVGARLMLFDGTTWDRGVNGAGTAAAAARATLASDDPAVASLSVLDDWDETNRAAVNLVAGQVGITAGDGAIAANTPRVTIATDNVVSVDWNGTAPPIGAGTEAAALRVTVATDSTGVLSVDDNGASLTVDVGAALPAGDADVGNVDLELAGTAVAGGSGTTSAGTIRVVPATDGYLPGERDVYVNDAGTLLAIQYVEIDLASVSATEVRAAVAANQIVVVGFKISASAALNIKWVDDTGGTPDDLSGLTYLAANGGWTAGYPEGRAVRLYATTSGENLGIDSSAADATSVEVWYVLEPD